MSEEDLTDAIKTIRTLLTARMLDTPVGTLQRETGADREARGACWVSRVVLPAPAENDTLNVILGAVRGLGNGNESYTIPAIENVRAQWTGHRAGVTKHEPEPNISEAKKFYHLQEEIKSPITILYIHGGNNYLLGPAARRATTSKLARLTTGKCLAVQYRLAPQNPFPAALLDCLIAYLTLLYPPAGSPNASALARHVVFAGDSGGAGLALSLVQVILYAGKQQGTENPTLEFHGQKVVLPMPAGLAFQSPSVDPQLTTLPSWAANFEYDAVPRDPPGYDAGFPMDEVWPSNPARGNYYCETSMLYHPLVCAMAANEWRGCPPIYMAIGSKERIVDAAKYFAQHVATQGVPVLWEEFELMPHNWPMTFPNHRFSEKCYRSWAKACSSFADGLNIQTRGTFIMLEHSQERELEVTRVTNISNDEVRRLMRQKESSIRPFTGQAVAKCHL
ncbi:MAG: hypothetical protein Q9207_004329 [Kuettlingeria erythrocarpa]